MTLVESFDGSQHNSFTITTLESGKLYIHFLPPNSFQRWTMEDDEQREYLEKETERERVGRN